MNQIPLCSNKKLDFLPLQPYIVRIIRAATGGKAAKSWSLARFSELESGGGSGGAPVKWPPLWLPWLPKIYHGGPVYANPFAMETE